MDLKSDMSSLFLRVALAASFLSAVADRFGIWGAYGHTHVAWGNFARFVNYTHVLTPAFPMSASVFFAWAATAGETVFAILLLAKANISPFYLDFADSASLGRLRQLNDTPQQEIAAIRDLGDCEIQKISLPLMAR